MSKQTKAARIAALEAQVEDLQAALREWRPSAANKVTSKVVDAHGIWRTVVNDYSSYDESTGWAFHPAGYL